MAYRNPQSGEANPYIAFLPPVLGVSATQDMKNYLETILADVDLLLEHSSLRDSPADYTLLEKVEATALAAASLLIGYSGPAHVEAEADKKKAHA